MKVSVGLITYNHERFITEALESVLGQNTSFEFEIVVGEDCSADHKRQILVEYQQRYPNKIRLMLPEKNLGANRNFASTLRVCRGQYIALLEGDELVFRGARKSLDRIEAPCVLFEANANSARAFGESVSSGPGLPVRPDTAAVRFFEIRDDGNLVRIERPNPTHSNILAVPLFRASRARALLSD